MDITPYIAEYEHFMGIDSFPVFSMEYYEVDLSDEYIYGARASFDANTKRQCLLIPSNFEAPKYVLFHELTHILDADRYSNGDKNHDLCLTGFMEYHASQIQMMTMMGSKNVSDSLSFSMADQAGDYKFSIQMYMNDKLELAKKHILDDSKAKRVEGLNALYNFYGLKSICDMYAVDGSMVQYDYTSILKRMSSLTFMSLRKTMTGWIEDIESIDKAVAIYSHLYRDVVG